LTLLTPPRVTDTDDVVTADVIAHPTLIVAVFTPDRAPRLDSRADASSTDGRVRLLWVIKEIS